MKGVVVRPNTLSKINLQAAKQPGKETNENRGQKYITAWVFDVLGQGCDSVKTSVSQGGHGGSRCNGGPSKGF